MTNSSGSISGLDLEATEFRNQYLYSKIEIELGTSITFKLISFEIGRRVIVESKFPTILSSEPNASMQILNAHTKTTTLDMARLQAKFDTPDSIMTFAQGVFVSIEYVVIRISNFFEKNEPIEVNVRSIKSKLKKKFTNFIIYEFQLLFLRDHIP